MKFSNLLFTSISFGVAVAVMFSLAGCGCGCTTTTQNVLGQTDTLTNLKSVNTSLLMYAQDYDETFPITPNKETVQRLLLPYNSNTTTYSDPNTGIPFEWNSYLSGKTLASIETPSTTVSFYVAIPVVPDSRPVATLGRNPRLVTDVEWTQLKTSSHIP